MHYEWDQGNLAKLATHGITPAEAIESLEDDFGFDLGAEIDPGEVRYAVLGQTSDGRVLLVLWTPRGEACTRILNAYEASSKLRRLYYEG